MVKNRIALLRKESGLTQEELAEKMNITRSALSLYELGKRDPDTETLDNFANFFGVSVDYLLGRTDTTSNNIANIKDNIKLIMKKMSVSQFVDDIRQKTGIDVFDVEDINSFLEGETIPLAPEILLLAEYAGVDSSFFNSRNTEKTLSDAQEKYKKNKSTNEEFDNEFLILYNKIKNNNLDIKLVNRLVDALLENKKTP